MIKILIGLMIFGSISCFSKEATKCSVSNLKEAQLCMDQVALEHNEYNQPNIGSVSIQKELLKKILKGHGRLNLKLYNTIDEADYLGVMLEKGDEWYLYYYALKKGKSEQVVILDDINLVDLNSNLIFPLTVKELILGDKNNKFKLDDRKYIQEYLDIE